ncbi:MAG: hypothetical protein H6709_15175 [Kofleriaceae bacterium]|nr:hypothetical protein [Myxococcales bacterium]MCB9561063.1 hypothetical protein [Kofleriaceae bacterium]MCB9573420.1 hypothetical protein [Kofleriaceae bacterium]
MARASWIDDDNNPHIDAHVEKLEHFTNSLADGVIDAAELETQEQNLIAAMRAVEPLLDDDAHAKVTQLLAELAAYTVMQMLHDMAEAKVRGAVS